MSDEKTVKKTEIRSIAERNRIVDRIIRAMEVRDNFLLTGHRNPDEDCIASMVALGILLRKLNKKVSIMTCSPIQEQFRYLFNICRYNAIEVFEGCQERPLEVSTLAILDTPKPSMIDDSEFIRELLQRKEVLKIELDHHLEADSEYSGDEDYRFVTEGSSTCELVGLLAFKIEKNERIKEKFQIDDLFSRNLVLAILTGIIGDTKMGKYLKTRKERWFYTWFSARFEELLAMKTFQGTGNFSSKDEVFAAIASLSTEEEACHRLIVSRKQESHYFQYVLLDPAQSQEVFQKFGNEVLIGVTKTLADQFAEASGHLGLVGYVDDPSQSSFVQFRIRRSQAFTTLDLRTVLDKLMISNGGGHPGAIGFRFEKTTVSNIESFAKDLIQKIEVLIEEL